MTLALRGRTAFGPAILARGLPVAAALGLPVVGGLGLAALLERPPLLVLSGIALAAGVALLALARRVGLLGLWLVVLVFSILAGELSAISLGGQSGRLLWADGVLGLGAVVVLLVGRGRLAVPRAPFLVALLPFLAWCAASLLVARDPLTAFAELKEWLAAAVVGAVAASYATDAARARTLLAAVALVGACLAAAMVYAAFHSPLGPVLAVLTKTVDLPWGRSNYLAGLLGLALCVALGLVGHAARPLERAAWAGVLVVIATGLVLSASKGAILALALGLGAVLAAAGREARVPRLVALAVVAAGAVLFAVGPLRQVAVYRLGAGAIDYSAGERLDLYRLAWHEFLAHPIAGLGLNNFSVISNRLHGVDTVPHNLELGFLAELGVPGLVLALSWIAALFLATRRARALARNAREHALALGLQAAFVQFAIHNQFESTLYGEQFKILLLATAAATWGLARSWAAEGTPKSAGVA